MYTSAVHTAPAHPRPDNKDFLNSADCVTSTRLVHFYPGKQCCTRFESRSCNICAWSSDNLCDCTAQHLFCVRQSCFWLIPFPLFPGTSTHSLTCEETGRQRAMNIRYAIAKESAASRETAAKASDGGSRRGPRQPSKTLLEDGWTEISDKRW